MFRKNVCYRNPYGRSNYGVFPPSLHLEYHQLCCCAGCLVVVMGTQDASAQCLWIPNLLAANGISITGDQKQCRLI